MEPAGPIPSAAGCIRSRSLAGSQRRPRRVPDGGLPAVADRGSPGRRRASRAPAPVRGRCSSRVPSSRDAGCGRWTSAWTPPGFRPTTRFFGRPGGACRSQREIRRRPGWEFERAQGVVVRLKRLDDPSASERLEIAGGGLRIASRHPGVFIQGDEAVGSRGQGFFDTLYEAPGRILLGDRPDFSAWAGSSVL